LKAIILVTRDAGHTIFFTSHELADVERVADHIGIIDLSVLRVCCPLETFRERIKRVRVTFAGEVPKLPRIPGLLECIREGQALRLLLTDAGMPSVAELSPVVG